MAGEVGAFNDPVDLLHEWQLCPGDVLCSAVFTTLCRTLRLRVVQLPYQAVMQPVRILSLVHLEYGVHIDPPQPAEEEDPLSGLLTLRWRLLSWHQDVTLYDRARLCGVHVTK